MSLVPVHSGSLPTMCYGMEMVLQSFSSGFAPLECNANALFIAYFFEKIYAYTPFGPCISRYNLN